METLKKVLFEDPLCLYVFLAVAELILLIHWRRRRTRKAAVRLLAPLGLAVVVFLIELAVVTLHEKLIGTIEQMAQHAEAVDMDALAGYLADDFELSSAGGKMGKSASVEAARHAVARYQVTSVKLIRHQIEMAGKDARTAIVTQIVTAADYMGPQNPFVSWQVHWRYVPLGWRIYRADQPELGLFVPIR